MSHVVANVTKYSSAVHHDSSIPVIPEDGVGELIERSRQDYE